MTTHRRSNLTDTVPLGVVPIVPDPTLFVGVVPCFRGTDGDGDQQLGNASDAFEGSHDEVPQILRGL